MRLWRWLFTAKGDAFCCLLMATGLLAAASMVDWTKLWRGLLLLGALYWMHEALLNWRWYERHLS